MDLSGLIANIGWLAATYFTVGLLLLIFEMFHPGFGVPGVTGIILLLLGIVATARTVMEALVMIVILIALLGIALSFVLSSATKGRLSKKLILKDSAKREAGFIGTEDLNFFLDKEGIALTVLRPAGTVDFDGVKLDVVSEGEFVPVGTAVKVIKVEGRRIVVRPQ